MKEDSDQFLNLASQDNGKYISKLKKMRSSFDKRLKDLGLKVKK